eukprot:2537982-Rhodomonas_salina.2
MQRLVALVCAAEKKRLSYAKSGTDLGYAPTRVHAADQRGPPTDLFLSSYARATPSPVLTQTIVDTIWGAGMLRLYAADTKCAYCHRL